MSLLSGISGMYLVNKTSGSPVKNTSVEHVLNKTVFALERTASLKLTAELNTDTFNNHITKLQNEFQTAL